ncbi:response regulator [Myxococcaceae bacterium JPH2]|nr:response regulator [Myxococcaceae bacterium JPH2]
MPAETSQRTVLVVEDDPDIRGAVCELLELEGYGIASARHGAEALQYLNGRAHLPSLILLDLMMPVLDGQGLLERLRADTRLSTIPVLVLTASPMATPPVGAVGLLRKPVQLEELLDEVALRCAPTH